MYTNTESTVINNGNTGKFFTLERGVRQGCPLPAYLFIIAIEILAIKIHNDPSIKGIKIGNNEIKICLLADDIYDIVITRPHLCQQCFKHNSIFPQMLWFEN